MTEIKCPSCSGVIIRIGGIIKKCTTCDGKGVVCAKDCSNGAIEKINELLSNFTPKHCEAILKDLLAIEKAYNDTLSNICKLGDIPKFSKDMSEFKTKTKMYNNSQKPDEKLYRMYADAEKIDKQDDYELKKYGTSCMAEVNDMKREKPKRKRGRPKKVK